MENDLIYIVCDFLVIFGMHIFCSRMFPDRKRIWLRRLAALVYVVVDCLVYFFLNNQIAFLTTSVVSYFMYTFAYSTRVNYKNFVATIILFAFGICSEVLAAFMVSFSSRLLGEYDAVSAVTATVVVSRIIFFILLLIVMRFNKFHNKDDASDRYAWSALVMPVLSVGLIIYIFNLIHLSQDTIHDSGSIRGVFAVAAIIAMNILSFYIINRLNRLYIVEREEARLKEAVLVQQAHFEEEKSVRENIRKVKHDTKNILIAIKSDIQAGKEESAVDAIDKELKLIDAFQLPLCNNLAIDSIIAYKANMAACRDITVLPEFRLEQNPQIESRDVCVLIGNALDNAIEYLENHPECKPEIRIQIVFSKGILDIKITNEVSERIPIKDNMISTTKSEEGHGYGLKSIKRIVEQYDGMLLLSSTDKEFEFGVIMNCRGE